MQAACALAQMDRLEEFIAKRRANFSYLKDRLQSCAEFLHLPQATPIAIHRGLVFRWCSKKAAAFCAPT